MRPSCAAVASDYARNERRHEFSVLHVRDVPRATAWVREAMRLGVDPTTHVSAINGEMLEPAQMRRTPVGALAKHEPATGEELQNVVPRLEDLPLKRFATPHDVADALLRLAGNAGVSSPAR